MHHVLIVDDERLVREAVRELADWPSFEVQTITEAPDAIQALETLAANPDIDIILTDMKMPELDGAGFLQELDRRQRFQAVIAISGFADYHFTRQAIRSGVVDYILKPVVADDLNLALSSALDYLEKSQPPVLSDEPILIDQGQMGEIRAYLDQHYLDKLSLKDLAKRFAISREHLSRMFKRSCGINLFDYISRCKIDEAKRKLAGSNLAIKAIAYELGFADEHYFSKVFRRWERLSPSEYRLKMRR